MADKIFYNPEGYIEVIIEGDQTRIAFKTLETEALKIIDKLQSENKPILALIDISLEGKFGADTNKAALEILEAIEYDRVAIFGGGKVLTEVVKGIILAMGKQNTKIFPDRQSAVNWLLSS